MEDQARLMAERIARRVASGAAPAAVASSGDVASELAAMRATLSELQNRLVQIEAKVGSAPRVHSPWSHPSLERFGVEEATVSELVDFFQNEKQCSVEPGGRPCDHCAMCSSRGF
jgi:hypothetical protein